MATAAQINAITALYVGYFDRAPDPAGLQFWIDQIDGGREFNTIAADFAASEEATALYPYLTTPDVSTPSAFIASIYANLFGRAPDAAGLAFWTGVLADGSVSVADMIEAIIIGAVDDADAGTFDKSVLDNKVEVGLDWALSVANVAGFTYDVDAAGAAAAAISGVTSDPATVDDALAATDAYVAGLELPTGETYTLTNGLDVLSGTPGDDNFFANNASWNVGDNVDGGLGVDTVTIANENQDLTLAGRTLTNVENVTVINIDPNTGTQDFNIANKMLDQVTVDYAGTDQETRLELDNMRADTDLVITNAIVNNDTVVRNDDGIYSTLTGSVSQNNTFSNINTVQENDYVDFENYAYFSNAMELNLSLTLEDFVTGDGGGEAGTFEDYIELEADNAVINVEYNLSNMVFENDYTEIYTYVENATDAADADVVNVVFNIDNVDGLYVDVDPEDSGTSTDSDSVTINVGSGGLADTDSSNYFEVDYFETLNFNIDGDADFGDFNAYSGVDAPQTVNIVANANMSIDTFDLADGQVVTINISGAGDVTFDMNGDNDGVVLEASGATGNLDIEVGTNTGGDEEMSVVAGSGDDIIGTQDDLDVDTGGTFSLYSFDGGDGFDTFEIDATDAVASEANLAAASLEVTDSVINFEALSLTGFGGDVVNATTWGLADIVTLADGYTTAGSLTVNNGATVTVAEGTNTDISLIVDGAGDAGSDDDSLTVNLESEDGEDYSDVTIADVETVNVVSTETDTNDTADTNTMDLIATSATTLNISGDAALDLQETNTNLTAVETVDAAGFDAGLIIDVSSSGEAVTVTTGAGADIVVGSDQSDTISVGNGGNEVTGGLGGDDITLGAGVTEDDVDTVAYGAVADSQGITVDTVNGFQVAVQSTDDIDTDGDVDADDVINDLIDLSAITAGVGSYLGEAGGYGQVLTSLTASGAAEAVLDTSTSTLYIDVDGSGTLDNLDMAINLTGVTDLSLDNFTF